MSTTPLRIANCSGFFGDRLSAAREMVDGGSIDILTGDWLAELTMGVLVKQRKRNADTGFARTFVHQLDEVLDTCLDRKIKIVSNAGGLNPHGCAAQIVDIAERIGSPRAVRAVARACATNNIALAIPCHRVVRTDGSLAGYRWGIDRKRVLLAREAQAA